MSLSFHSSSLLVGLLVFSAGCREAKVTAYRAPKDSEVLSSAESSGSSSVTQLPSASAVSNSGPQVVTVSTDSAPSLVWTAPASWVAKPTTPMRKGSYSVSGENGEACDLSITAFPGAVGGELANLNRWRGQLNLPPIESEALESAVSRLSVNNLTFAVVDLRSAEPKPRRILGP